MVITQSLRNWSPPISRMIGRSAKGRNPGWNWALSSIYKREDLTEAEAYNISCICHTAVPGIAGAKLPWGSDVQQ